MYEVRCTRRVRGEVHVRGEVYEACTRRGACTHTHLSGAAPMIVYTGKVTETTRLIRDGEKGGRGYGGGGRGRL